ncbi:MULTISPECIES: MFS transporter [Streptomyces]|uniref:MFS transporter n=1 Tax=Streptomyces TaxID=1883 RepID=UPI0007C7B94D|nr:MULTISPECIES: MFS transporter [unclassified Streptomyces]RUP63586.1 putative sulfoacetate transporter SauU [Streptomyces sp. NP10]SNB90967.1 Predicted arabinose efflux permease, MFS family [Streptomyces sp. PgraA7]
MPARPSRFPRIFGTPQPGRTTPLSRTARTTVVLLFGAWFIDYADRLVINFVLPEIGDEFGLTRGQQGLLISAFFIAYAVCQIPGGMLADRIGGRRVALWALLVWTLFTALTGLAWSFAALLVLRVLFGLAQGVFPPAATKILVERSRPEERMRANGLILSSNAVAAVLTPLLVAPLVAFHGWRSAYISVAALGVFVYTAIRLRLPEPLSEGGETPVPAHGKDTRSLLRWGVLWRFAAMMFGYSLIIWGLSSWVPTYLKDERGVDLGAAGALMAIPGLAAAVATVLGGRIADRAGGRHRRVVLPAMAVAAAMLPVMAYTASVPWFIALSTVAVFAAALCYMPIMAVPIRSLSAQHIGVASGVMVFGGQLAGVTAPTVMGLLADAFSFQVAFAFLATGAVIAAVAACLTPQDTRSFLAGADARIRAAAPATDTGVTTKMPFAKATGDATPTDKEPS